jgi:(p)ppGpp synthase/HD superfamily hydrolase
MNIEEKALKMAQEAHKGQPRHDNITPYISHPMAVADTFTGLKGYDGVSGEEIRAIALLHDVIEDSNTNLWDLICAGFSDNIIKTVDILTKKDGINYLDYILKVKENSIAKIIKLADIRHNLSTLDPKKKAQRDKYLLSIYILEN